MGILADSLFSVLMGWVRALVSGIWALFTSDRTTLLEFLGKNWLWIAGALIVVGLVVDWLIWLLRWQPYHLWAQRVRRILGMEEPEAEDDESAELGRAHAAVVPTVEEDMQKAPVDDKGPAEYDGRDVEEEIGAMPDEHAYPGMYYESAVQKPTGETRRYGVLTQEGPGAEEVQRRKAEIEAWNRQQAETEKRRHEEAVLRLQEAERERLAQEAYARELEAYRIKKAEYEQQKAQYERDMAEYERQKVAYDAQVAQAENQHRRRNTPYSDAVLGEEIYDLPDAPTWPDVQNQGVKRRR